MSFFSHRVLIKLLSPFFKHHFWNWDLDLKHFPPVWFHSSYVFLAQKLCFTPATEVHPALFCKMQQLVLMTARDESCCPARMSKARAAVSGILREGRIRIWGGISHRAELNLCLCWEAFSAARMPAPTTEVNYHLANHSSHGRKGLVGLAKFWLNLGAQGGRKIQIHLSKDKKLLNILLITALQFPKGFSVVTQITKYHVLYNRG